MFDSVSDPGRRSFLKSLCAAGTTLAASGMISGLLPLNALAGSGPAQGVGTGSVKVRQQTRLLMGTLVTLSAVAEAGRAEEAFALAFAEMERLVAVFDRRDPSSALGVLNTDQSLYYAPEELIRVLEYGKEVSRITDDAFNPAVTPLLQLIAQSRAANSGVPAFNHLDLKEAVALAAPGGIRITKHAVRLDREGMRLTLDGVAKGYVADAASVVLRAQGLRNHMVNAGGDIRVSGRSAGGAPWTVGIRHPDNPSGLLAAVPVLAGGIATSGSYENSFNRSRTRHHLVSHQTGKSAEVTSVTVRAASAMQADALATAFSLLAPVEALRHTRARPGVACLIVDRQGRQFPSDNWI